MLTAEGHVEVQAFGGAREPRALSEHDNWKAGLAAFEAERTREREEEWGKRPNES